MRIGAVIVGAGAGRRMGLRQRKALAPLGGRPMLLWSLEAFARVREVADVVVVLDARDIGTVMRRWGRELRRARVRRVVPGGAARHESVRRGLMFVDSRCDVVLVHDAARPFVPPALIRRVARAAARHGAAVPLLALADTIKRVAPSGRVVGTEDRCALRAAQTPQGLSMRRVLELATRGIWRRAVSDDVGWLELLGRPVVAVSADEENWKVTTRADYRRAQDLARRRR